MNETQRLSQQAKEVLKRAVVKALEKKQRLGQYAVIYQNGRVMHLEPDEIAEKGRG
ncbi:hypothetical protein NEA10_05690 [Phormidium yuhuli AB48]|uniref:DUF2292 domain-containing protein n=1 Tax=Phormidium yuhuli AB48 TaxID=2940671 RepID=A0ABY5AV64_9CYAN|nr:hypothetical protein [Phormidium yuhuli]USR92216.1 hypothetical protein NEA10_05690 [Phormidium yuhuli AB48]